MSEQLVAPMPYFGGKRKIAPLVWQRLGTPMNYIEPFCGTCAVLLARPHAAKTETVSDVDHFIANFWRATQAAPDEVAKFADWPVSEADLEARHFWLITEGAAILRNVMGTPDGYDAKIAGWWLWGACSWIGGGWCSGDGPWQWNGAKWVDKGKLPHVGSAGMGINRQLPHVGNAGMGINRQLPHVGNAGRAEFIQGWMRALADRLRDVRICCGDWSRVCGDSVTFRHGTTGVLMDPPYSADDRSDTYTHDSRTVSHDARAWAIEAGANPLMRIAFCGYDGEFADLWPEGWTELAWKAIGGYGSQGDADGRKNAHRERIWFSPHCLPAQAKQADLFAGLL